MDHSGRSFGLTLGKLGLEKGDLLLLLDEEFLAELSNDVAHLGGVVNTDRVFGELFEFAFESFDSFFILLKLGASLGLSLSGGLGESAERIFKDFLTLGVSLGSRVGHHSSVVSLDLLLHLSDVFSVDDGVLSDDG